MEPTQPPQDNHQTLKVSTSSDPHHFPKVLLIGIAAVLILIIGGGLGYFLGANNQSITDQTPSPTPLPAEASAKVGADKTANWKTYIDKDFKFSIQYPQSWYAVRHPNDINFYISDKPIPDAPITHVLPDTFSIVVIPASATRLTPTPNPDLELSDIIINDTPAKKSISLKPDARDGGIRTFISFIYLEKEYIISFPNIDVKGNHNKIFDQILSTLKFTTENSQSSNVIVRTIAYKKASDWVDFTSQVGYSLQHPQNLKPVFQILQDNQCTTTISGQGTMGFILAIVKTYDGGSRRALLGTLEGSTYTYEEVLIQGRKSLLRQETSSEEPASVAVAVIPVGKHALILSWSKETVTNTNFNTLLQSLQIPNELDLSKCNRINNP